MEIEELARLILKIEADTAGFRSGVARAEKAATDMGRRLVKEGESAKVFSKTIDELGTKMSNMAGQMRAMAGLEMPFAMVKSGVSLAGEAEDMEIAFRVMLGSGAKAKDMMKELQDFAAKTPLTMAGLTQTTKTLLQFRIAGEDVIPVLKTLGDVAGGEQDKLSRMALAFGQMSSTGRLMGEELNQMVEAGFNPLKEISRTTGRSMLDLREDMERGKISVGMVTDAFKSATSAGGPMAGMLEARSKSFKGLFSTMTDDVDAFRRTLGQTVIEQFRLKEAMQDLSNVAQGLTAWFSKLDVGWKMTAAGIAAGVAAMGLLVVTWKVGAIAIGMVVGVLKDIIITLKWVVPLLKSYKVAVVTSTAATVAFKVALVAGVVYAVGLAVSALVGGRKALRDFNEELDRGNKLLEKSLEGAAGRETRTLEAAVEIKNPEEKLKFLNEQLAAAERNAEGNKSNVERLEKAVNDMDTTGHFLARNIPLAGRGHASEFAALNADLDEAKKRYEAAKASAARFREEVKSVRLPGTDPATVQAVKEMNKRMGEQALTFGLTGHEAEIMKVKLMGATEAQLANARGVAAMLKEMAEAKRLSDDVKVLTDNLKEQTEAIGMDADEAKLHALAVRGATEEQLAEARALVMTRNVLQEQTRLREEASKAIEGSLSPLQQLQNKVDQTDRMFRAGLLTVEQYKRVLGGAVTEEALSSFERLDRKIDETALLLSKGAITLETYKRILGGSVAQEVATPLEKFNDRLRELQMLFDAGAISGDVFDRAVKKSAGDLGLVEEQANSTRDALRGVDAALAGSAEARSRIYASQERLKAGRPDANRPGNAITKVQLAKSPNDPAAQETNKLLKAAAKSLDKIAVKPTFVVEPAGFGGI